MTKHKYKLFKKYMVFLGYEKYIRKIPRRLLQEHLKSLPDGFWTDDDYPHASSCEAYCLIAYLSYIS